MLHHNQPSGSPWGGGKQAPPNLSEVFYTILHHLNKMVHKKGIG
jgi:membrane protease subunit HflK